jgi:hypothetical protein
VTPTESVDSAAAVHKDDAVTTEEGRGASTAADTAPVDVAKYQEMPGPNVEVPHEQPQPRNLEPTENAEEVYTEVLKEQLDKGSSPQVAEARAKVARVKAERGIKRGPTPIYTPNLVPSAPTGGHEEPSIPSGAPSAAPIQPDPGPVAPAGDEAAGQESTAGQEPAAGAAPTPSRASQPVQPAAGTAAAEASSAGAASSPGTEVSGATPAGPGPATDGPATDGPATDGPATEEPAVPIATTPVDAGGTEDPEAAYERVLAEERAKGSSDAVAVGRAKAARVRAQKVKDRPV